MTLPRALSVSTESVSFLGGQFLRALAVAACVLIGSTGCQIEPAPDLVVINGTEPESLDPAIVTGVSEMRLTKALFEGLLRLDGRTGRPIPALASRWEVSADGTVYTFHLRTNALWSTGDPITAEDVVYSWIRALRPETAADYAGQLFYIRNAEAFCTGQLRDAAQVGVRALDRYRVEVRLEDPVAFFLDICCYPTLAVVPRQTIEPYGDRWLSQPDLPVSGPFCLDEWRLNARIRLRRNTNYWDAANTRSAIIDVLPTGSPNTALNLYESGEADIVWDKELVPTDLLDILLPRPDFHTFDGLGAIFFRFNVTRRPFQDVRVRQALAHATDRQRLVRKLTRAGEKAATHLVPPGIPGYTSPQGLDFDPERARQLLAEAGFPGGRGFPRCAYSYYSASGGAGKLQAKMAVELQQMWREALGIEVELRQIERKVFFNAQSRLDFDLSSSSWIGDYNDPNTFLDLFLSNGGNNRTGWKSAEYDALIREANRRNDPSRRAALFQQAEQILIAREAPIVPLYFYAGFNYFDPARIKGLHQNLLDEHPFQDLWRASATGPTALGPRVPTVCSF